MRLALAFLLALSALVLASSSAVADRPRAHTSDLDCADFTCQEDAQAYFISRGGPSQDPDRLDGDTVRVRLGSGKRVTVRLIGVDTPETKPGTPAECGGKQATANMKRRALKRSRGRGVTLATDPTQDRTDRFGRLLAYAKVDSGRDLAREQIRAGWGMAYVYDRPFERFAAYDAAQTTATGASRGVWGACGGSFHSSATGSVAASL